ncbi:MAG: signal peptidase I [Clostridia bacterium]|nr:signal peptidase I [Clostridia bacterium]
MTKPAEISKGRKIYRTISSIITLLVALFLCGVALLAIVQRSTDKSPHVFGYYMYTVLTDSMEPTLMVGDVILSKQAVAEELKVGDIVTYKAETGALEGYNLTHRIVRLLDVENVKYVVTQGDNTSGEDAPVEAAHISSVYVRNLDSIAGILSFLKTPQGFICIIVLPLLLVLVLIIVSYFRDRLKLEKQEAISDFINKNKDKKDDKKFNNLDELSDDEKIELLEEMQKHKESKVDKEHKEEK